MLGLSGHWGCALPTAAMWRSTVVGPRTASNDRLSFRGYRRNRPWGDIRRPDPAALKPPVGLVPGYESEARSGGHTSVGRPRSDTLAVENVRRRAVVSRLQRMAGVC